MKDEDISEMAYQRAVDWVRRENDNYRCRLQTSLFTHNEIRDAIAHRASMILNMELIEIESPLVNSRIDILCRDIKGNIVGIEVKKKSIKKEITQFNRYRDELKSLYGPTSRLIILSSCYTNGVLGHEQEDIELYRYEIWWKYTKGRKGKGIYFIQDLRICLFNKDTSSKRLFEDYIDRNSIE